MSGTALETAVVGFRGAVGASVLFGGHLSTHQAAVLFPGTAFKIRVEDLRHVINERREARAHIAGYVEALTLHCAQTGFCGVWHHREERLASWLCLARHAADSDVLPVTHDYLSSVLGLPRPGITETLNEFAKQRLIRKMRGVLQIDKGNCLEQRACACYKFVADAYASSGSEISA
ncbi:Crp/Fnr family transcriptional regulator [Bradyrhizobium sp. 33ap4]|uniref:Crp/Fnr family transcriptional regulator n=1 Tax=Bradyrhizobium sp. 33ap4 TaxID=3061630 RepID=UPI002930C280|nr:helix-turn-helix domain-containing protein [Bradyrhizobium sp. 33ap4]